MKQGKLEVVKPVNILGIRELKGLEWVNLTQMTIISEYLTITVNRNPLEEMEYPSWSTKDSYVQYLDAISKMKKMNFVCFQGKPFYITVTIFIYYNIEQTSKYIYIVGIHFSYWEEGK